MENSRFKFRAWDKDLLKMYSKWTVIPDDDRSHILMQYTGLKDKNGVEIYEYMEIDNIYEVSFLNASYVLTNISNGDIIPLSYYMENNNGKVQITREYTKV